MTSMFSLGNPPYHLYKHYNGSGELLYVGISLNAFKRNMIHEKHADWFDEVEMISIERYASKDLASEAEIKAIKNESPLYNVKHTPAKRTTFSEKRHYWVDLYYKKCKEIEALNQEIKRLNR